ncbi:MAG: hypothetical protein ACRC8S_17480 [Fimbriiglobus sp.]
MKRSLFLAFSLAAMMLMASADETPNPLPKQQEAVKANITAAKLKNYVTTETDHLILTGPYTAEKLTKFGTEANKTYVAAMKAMKIEAKDDPIPGKLALYFFPDSKQTKLFYLQALKQSPRGKSASDMNLRSETPWVVINTGLEDKPSDASISAISSKAIATAILNHKAGTTAELNLPAWLEIGFANAAILRAEGNASKLSAHKAKVKALTTKTKGAALSLSYLWAEQAIPESELIFTSLVEYFIFGPGAEKFPTILTSLKPGEGNDNPSLKKALDGLEWKYEELEAEWRKWVLSGK